MSLGDMINLERVNIVEEAKDFYKVQYKGQEYQILKSSETHFAIGSCTPSAGMELRLEQILLPGTGIFQDESVPPEFKEVMMFHEIRESEYKNAGFADGHERAVNDEVLYALKFFTPKQRTAYFRFAEKYRKEHTKIPDIALDKITTCRTFGISRPWADIEIYEFDKSAGHAMDNVFRRLEADFSSRFHMFESRIEYEHYVKTMLKQIKYGITPVVIDGNHDRLKYIARIPSVVTIDANQQDVEKRMYETCKALMKKPE